MLIKHKIPTEAAKRCKKTAIVETVQR